MLANSNIKVFMKKVLKRLVYYTISMVVIFLLSTWSIYLYNTSYTFHSIIGDGSENSHIGEAFPNFELRNHKGELITVSDIKGSKYILIDFWFSGCKPCMKGMREFPRMLEEYGSELKILSISIDSFQHMKFVVNTKPNQWAFLDNNHPNWLFGTTNDGMSDELIKTLNIQSFPAYFILDNDGYILERPIYANLSLSKLRSTFGISTRVMKELWKMYEKKDIIKFYRALFILSNIFLLIVVLVRVMISWIRKLLSLFNKVF